MESKSSSYEKRSSSYQSSSGGVDADPSPFVRPIIANRSVVVTRSAPSQYSSLRMTSGSRISNMGSASFAGPGAGYYASMSSTGMSAMKENHQKEKRDMQDLNEKFANYLEKVRFLEAQNRKLADELKNLKDRWGKETSQIKAMYEVELEEARKLLDDTTKEKARLEIRVASLEDEVSELKQR